MTPPPGQHGIITAWHYDFNHDSAVNKAFVKAYAEANPGPRPNFLAVGGYDGMHLVYEALTKTGGSTDAQALVDAATGMSWESPRGPITIDPETRDIVQTVYIRRVEKLGGELANANSTKSRRSRTLRELQRGSERGAAGYAHTIL